MPIFNTLSRYQPCCYGENVALMEADGRPKSAYAISRFTNRLDGGVNCSYRNCQHHQLPAVFSRAPRAQLVRVLHDFELLPWDMHSQFVLGAVWHSGGRGHCMFARNLLSRTETEMVAPKDSIFRPRCCSARLNWRGKVM